jgi:hypothetical protein
MDTITTDQSKESVTEVTASKTILIMYMPGYAGNFLLRLFGLSKSLMPHLEKRILKNLLDSNMPVSEDFDKLSKYKFSSIPKIYKNWQDFHRAYADMLDYSDYRLLNLMSGFRYNFIFSAHPYEINTSFVEIDQTEFYYVELDTKLEQWVNQQQKKLNFVERPMEKELFDLLKNKYRMSPIYLIEMLISEQNFVNEYRRVCKLMKIEPCVEQALILLSDWKSVRHQ